MAKRQSAKAMHARPSRAPRRSRDCIALVAITFLFDSDFCQCRKLCPACYHGGWLSPFAIKAIVQHVAVPTSVSRAGIGAFLSTNGPASARLLAQLAFGFLGFAFLCR